MNALMNEPASFRDRFSGVDEQGKRNWVYPQKPKGLWHRRRVFFSIFLLGLLCAGPFIRFNGQPLLLFNVVERKFIIFGLFIGPQDYWLFGLMTLAFMVFILLFTTVFGRLWCGWACPQTVLMEMVFRKIEYFIEGDRPKQIALNKAPWTSEKIFRKGTKYLAFLIVSFATANLLLAYVIGTDELGVLIREPLADHLGLFGGVVAFTAVFYFNFAWLREQACTTICPYGRLQSVLLDKNSIVVAYDYVRGEPRGKLRKGQERAIGDCISCNQCVVVCPTNIDIRNGTQMECINCTACIDACDSIMERTGFDTGLIRYTSEKAITEKTQKLLSTRVIGYAAVFVALFISIGVLVAKRDDTQTTLLRVPGSRYIENTDGTISNLYNFKIFNKTNREIHPDIRLTDSKGTLLFAGKPNLSLDAAGFSEGTVFIILPKTAIKNRKTELQLAVYENGKKLEELKTVFIAPEY